MITGYGESIAEALGDMSLRAPREVYWGHLSVVLLGEEVLETGVQKAIDYFMRQNQVRRSTLFVAAKGEARDVLISMADISKESAFYIKTLIEDQENRVKASSTNLNEVIIGIPDKGIDTYLPVVQIVSMSEIEEKARAEAQGKSSDEAVKEAEEKKEQSQDDQGQGKNQGDSSGESASGGDPAAEAGDNGDKVAIELSGAALLKGDRLAGWVDQEWCRGYY